MIPAILAMALAVDDRPPAPIPPNPCKPAESCRYVEDFVLRRHGGDPQEARVERWLPFLTDGTLQLYPGEFVTIGLEGGRPVVLAHGQVGEADRQPVVEDTVAAQDARSAASGKEGLTQLSPDAAGRMAAPPRNGLRIAFVQIDGRPDMMLRVANGFDRPVVYKASIRARGEATGAPTTVCPVRAGKAGLEGWPDPLVEIDLSGFSLAQAEAAEVSLADCQ